MTAYEIESAIHEHRSIYGGSFSQWYIGITDNPKRRLEEHEQRYDHILNPNYWTANSKEIAAQVEKWGLNQNMQGNTGGGNGNSYYVYIFKPFEF